MPDYREYARFYDRRLAALMGGRDQGVNFFSTRVRGCIERHMPRASSLLDLGCGTGAVLAGLPELPSLTGLDISPHMLAIARSKVPAATFIQGDMTSFCLDRQFDVIICVFDTLNHLLDFSQWIALFNCVRGHLADGGIFVFDVVTTGGFRRLTEAPASVLDLGRDTLVAKTELADGGILVWDGRIFEHLQGNQFALHHERIREIGVPLDRITAALASWFELIELTDHFGKLPDDSDSDRAYFVAAKRGDST